MTTDTDDVYLSEDWKEDVFVIGRDVNGHPIFSDEDPCDCGTVFGDSGLYLTHAVGAHPDCSGLL